jgi:hypothetical protein
VHGLRFYCIHQGLHTSPKGLSQVTSLAKQPDPVAQTNGCESVAYQNERVRHLAVTTALTRSGEERLFQETEAAFGCQELFKCKRPDHFPSSNTAPNVNRITALKMFPLMREDYHVTRRVNSVYQLFRNADLIISQQSVTYYLHKFY